jgi:hypothetical protein
MHMGERDVLLAAVGAMRRAVFGRQSEQGLDGGEVCERALSSSIWPSRVSEMITAAASKYTPTWP